MSDFPEIEGFSGATAGGNADFLARERELLGDEFGGAPAGYNPADFDAPVSAGAGAGSFPELDGGPAPPRASSFDMDELEPRAPPAQVAAAAAAPPPPTVNDDLAAFDSKFPELEEPSLPQTNGYGAPAQSLYGQNVSYQAEAPSLYQTTQMPEEESEHIKAWREKQAEEIRRRDERSKAKREETIAAAERAIDDFYTAYNNEKEKTISRNKEQEAAFLQARDDALGHGTTWQRVADLVDLQDSRSKTVTKSQRDLTRFKEVILSLKRDGESAPGAAGY